MNRVFQIIACVLAAVWLPVTQHCRLEAAGLLAEHAGCEHHEHATASGASCEHDGCDLVEDGDYRQDAVGLHAPHPDLRDSISDSLDVLSLLLVVQGRDTTSRSYPFLENSHEWVATWSFVRRTAAQPRGPSLIV